MIEILDEETDDQKKKKLDTNSVKKNFKFCTDIDISNWKKDGTLLVNNLIITR